MSYDEALNNMNDEDYEKWLSEANDYNRSLLQQKCIYLDGEPKGDVYKNMLNVTNSGVLGYISIKKLGILLPIYHGTAERVLSIGVGHLEGSSLPVGGEGTHAVLTGHRGLPSAKLFTDLDLMDVGDVFSVVALKETKLYEVDQIKIVSPYETDLLDRVVGEDYITLITCTPYAVNTHRLLVRGRRIEAPNELRVTADAMQIDPIIVAPIVAAPILLGLLCFLLFEKPIKENQKTKKGKGRKS